MEMRQYVTESLAFLLAQNMDRGIPEYQCKAIFSPIDPRIPHTSRC